MRVRYIIGDEITGQVWYGVPPGFSVPGRTNATPIYFNTYEQALAGCKAVKGITRTEVVMIPTLVFLFSPEEQPPEKFERLKELSYEPPAEAKLLREGLSYTETERIMMKITHDTLMMIKIYLN